MDFLKYPIPEKGNPKMAIIIDNRTFGNSYAERNGNDGQKMEEFLLSLGFGKLESFENLSCDDMRAKLGEAVKNMQEAADNKVTVSCFLCVILSYGVEGSISGASGEENDKMEVREVMDMFNGTNCPSLIEIGAPKLFFIQTCPTRSNTQRDGPNTKTDVPEDQDKIQYQIIPVEADQLLVQSCIPGYLGWTEKGNYDKLSWFIKSLIKSIGDGKTEDIMSSLTKMLRELHQKIRGASQTKTEMKLPYISSTLRKDFHFCEKPTV